MANTTTYINKIVVPSGANTITANLVDTVSGYTKNTGTVTSIGVSAGTGMSVSGSPVTTSGTITVGHSNSVTAQTTQALYPIKIDAQGHISAYGTAVTVPTVTDTYSSTGTDAVSGKAVNAALQTLDSSVAATSGQAISAITITDGKIASSSKISVGDANQNAFSNVKVGSTTVAADTTTDTLELVAGDGITLTPDATNDKITIAGMDINDVYPIGSVYVTSTNTNPSTTIGGTWTLVDKEFKSQQVSGGTPADRFTINTTNITSLTTFNLTRSGHSITYELNVKLKVNFTDSELEIGTFNLANIGVTSFARTLRSVMWSDGGNGIAMITLTPAGVLTSYDVVTKTSGGSIAATNELMGYFTVTFIHDHMLDSFCDKFYWKRTA